MNRLLVKAALVVSALAIAPVYADQVFEVRIAEQAAEEYPHFEQSQEDIDALAKLLWSSPLRDRAQKEKLCWCVCNRVRDERFDDTVTGCINKKEFTWYDRHAHISEENQEIAEYILNRAQCEDLGYNTGAKPSGSAVFVRFTGNHKRTCELTAEKGGNAIW